MAALEAHIKAVRAHSLLGNEIDFKLAPSSGPRSPQAAEETGFTCLSVTLCKVIHPVVPHKVKCFCVLISCTRGAWQASTLILHVGRVSCAGSGVNGSI